MRKARKPAALNSPLAYVCKMRYGKTVFIITYLLSAVPFILAQSGQNSIAQYCILHKLFIQPTAFLHKKAGPHLRPAFTRNFAADT